MERSLITGGAGSVVLKSEPGSQIGFVILDMCSAAPSCGGVQQFENIMLSRGI